MFAKAAEAVALEIVAKDQSAAAISYFSSVRIPAGLIAGSALAALFSLVDKAKDGEISKRSQVESIVLIMYHLLSISSLLLSLNVIFTSTALVDTIMFGQQDPIATSPFELMTREYSFEFLMTRWSFFVSLFSFLGSVATRALIQFDLLHMHRLSSAILVMSSFGALYFHLLAFVNSRLFLYNNMGEMTLAVFSIWFQRSITGRGPCELASIACCVVSMGTAVALFLRSGKFSSHEEEDSSAPIVGGTGRTTKKHQ